MNIEIQESFSSYLQSISEYRVLSKMEIYECFDTYYDTNDNSYIEKIILHHLKFVVHVAKQYINYGLPLPDLVQEGNYGLLYGIRKFDHVKAKKNNTMLSTFVVHDIKHCILDYIIKNLGLVKPITTKGHRKIFFNRQKFNSYKRPLTDAIIEQISNDMNVTPDSIRDMEMRLTSRYISTNISDNGDDSDDHYTQEIKALTNNDINIETTIIANEQRQILNKSLSILSDREADIITKRWLSSEKYTLEKLSSIYNISKERVRQIEKNSIIKLRKYYEECNG